jgi:hypothetical protein
MRYVFADEAGNFDFSAKGTGYFIVTALVMEHWKSGGELLDLRHELALEGADLFEGGFHASEEKQAIRDRVFPIVQKAELEIHAVVLDKRKTEPRIAANEWYFYQLAWHFLFKYLASKCLLPGEPVLVVGSSLGTKARKERFRAGLQSVVNQNTRQALVKMAFWSASSHPCLQLADYCAWAIQRWKERGDDRSWVLIQPKVKSCFEPFQNSNQTYY